MIPGRLLFLGTRLRRDQACEAVVNDQLAIVLATVLDESVGVIEDPNFLVAERLLDCAGQAFLAFRLDGCGAVGK